MVDAKVGLALLVAIQVFLLACRKDFTELYANPERLEATVANMVLLPDSQATCTLSQLVPLLAVSQDELFIEDAAVWIGDEAGRKWPMTYQGEGVYRSPDSLLIEEGAFYTWEAYVPPADTLRVARIETPISVTNLSAQWVSAANAEYLELSWSGAHEFFEINALLFKDTLRIGQRRWYVDGENPDAYLEPVEYDFQQTGDTRILKLFFEPEGFDFRLQAEARADSLKMDIVQLSEPLFRLYAPYYDPGGLESLFFYAENPYTNIQGGYGIAGALLRTSLNVPVEP